MEEERRAGALIGASLIVEGNLTSSEDVTIAGQVRGDVVARNHTLTVSHGARIHGNVLALAVIVHGDVAGNVTATQRAEVSATGVVNGDITSPRMVVAEGAALSGQLKIGGVAARPTEGPPSAR